MRHQSILRMSMATLSLAALVFFTSCVKDREGQTDFSGLTPIVQIVNGGLDGLKNASLVYPSSDISDTTSFRLNYASKTVAPRDIKVTLGYDAAALAAYNATLPASQQYEKFPDSIYSFTQTTVTIKAGQSYSDLVKLVVYPGKIDVSKNYLLPISITAADGINISGNFGTIYFNVVGNPRAGKYLSNAVRTRYNGANTSSGVLDSFVTVNLIKTYVPAGSIPIEGTLADLGSGVTVDLVVNLTTNAVAVIARAGVAATLIDTDISTGSTYNPTTKTFTLKAEFLNTAGNLRTVRETLVKQ